MPDIRESDVIAGVKIVHLTEFADSRGRFLETFRKEWFPERVEVREQLPRASGGKIAKGALRADIRRRLEEESRTGS